MSRCGQSSARVGFRLAMHVPDLIMNQAMVSRSRRMVGLLFKRGEQWDSPLKPACAPSVPPNLRNAVRASATGFHEEHVQHDPVLLRNSRHAFPGRAAVGAVLNLPGAARAAMLRVRGGTDWECPARIAFNPSTMQMLRRLRFAFHDGRHVVSSPSLLNIVC